MSRSGYTDDCEDNWAMIRWRGVVASATRGKRGQQFFRELLEALDAMPVKRLIADNLVCEGEFCTLGVLGAKRDIEMTDLDPDDSERVAQAFNIAECLAQEVVFMNDEAAHWRETPEQRFARMREWVAKQIKQSVAEAVGA